VQSTDVLRVGVFLGGLLAAQAMSRAAVVTYAAPAGEALSSEYEVVAEGKKVDVYTARVLDPPFAGQQWNYGGPYAFANFDMEGRVTVRVTAKHSLTNAVVSRSFPMLS
jgi:hypothetical protein